MSSVSGLKKDKSAVSVSSALKSSSDRRVNVHVVGLSPGKPQSQMLTLLTSTNRSFGSTGSERTNYEGCGHFLEVFATDRAVAAEIEHGKHHCTTHKA